MFDTFPYMDYTGINLDWIIKEMKNALTEWSAVKNEWSNYKEYIDNYFRNLDVTQEIRDKIDDMIADGSFNKIVSEYIDPYVQEISVLSARVDKFEQLKQGSTTGDAELQDIRISNTGKTYPTAGDAVRAQTNKALGYAEGEALAIVEHPFFTKNVLNRSTCVEGGYYNPQHVWTERDKLYSTDLIPCVTGEKFVSLYRQTVHVYDGNKEWLGGIQSERNEHGFYEFTAQIASGKACYFRMYGEVAKINTDAIFNGSIYLGNATEYPFNKIVLSENVLTRYDFYESLFTNLYKNLGGSFALNIFNPATTIDGGYYNASNVWTPNENLYSSDYIPVFDGVPYSIGRNQPVPVYDKNKKHIGYVQPVHTEARDYTIIPTSQSGEVRYIRTYGFKAQKQTDGVYIGEKYYPDAGKYPYMILTPLNCAAASGLVRNKIIYTFGDSRTWYDGRAFINTTTQPGVICKGYQSYMREQLQCITVNKGRSGYDAEQILPVVEETDITSADIVTLAGGYNDFNRNKTIGSIAPVGSDFDRTTVYGATQAAIESILTRKPTVKLMLINDFTGWKNVSTTDLEMTEAYANIKREIAALYKLPILDLYKFSGFNKLNRAALYVDDLEQVNGYVHLNNDGYKIIGQMVTAFVGNGF